MSRSPVKLNQALVRPLLVMGGEREPVGIVAGCAIVMLLLGWQFVSPACLIIGVLTGGIGLYALRRIAKRDPQMFAVYRRFIAYQKFYPARSTPFRRG